MSEQRVLRSTPSLTENAQLVDGVHYRTDVNLAKAHVVLRLMALGLRARRGAALLMVFFLLILRLIPNKHHFCGRAVDQVKHCESSSR